LGHLDLPSTSEADTDGEITKFPQVRSSQLNNSGRSQPGRGLGHAEVGGHP
jgi:hypothetical protein